MEEKGSKLSHLTQEVSPMVRISVTFDEIQPICKSYMLHIHLKLFIVREKLTVIEAITQYVGIINTAMTIFIICIYIM